MFGKKYYGLTGTKLNIAVGVIAGLDFLLFGYDQGVMGGLLTLKSFTRTFPEINTQSPPRGQTASYVSTVQGISIASYNLGCFVGALMTIWIGDWLGRRKTIFLGSAIMVIGATLQTSAFSLGHLIAGRVITGVGNGMNTSTVPSWQSECSKSHRRGQMVMIEGALITGGVCMSYWIDFGFSFLEPSTVSWRFPIALQILFALIILMFIMGLPESPRWLIMKGQEDEALNVLCALNDKNSEDPYIVSEFAAIKDSAMIMQQGGFRDLFTMDEDRNFHRVVLAYVNQMFQQISGINLITYYAASIYETSIGLSGFLSRILAAANGTEYFLASWIAVFTIEKFGRRQLMLFGAAGQAASMAILAGTTSRTSSGLGITAAVFLFVFNTFFAIGWLGMTWLYPAEIVPLRIRAPANALATSANWIFNFMVVMITPVAFETIGYQTYIIFAVINAFIVPCVYFFYPETRLRSLEEMDEIFRNTTSIFNVVSVARDTPNRYGKNGELLINYMDTEAAAGARRRSSLVEPKYGHHSKGGKGDGEQVERLENGYGSSSAASGNEKV
ncbi:general substrate transporter [Aureobasidium pullulans EXF-150]|uniref:General substrate transporter n=1 Tax=Aureobasidium pullulans EXF-150 TaxID=1043002 RepID=A0A074XVK9_AURPU|nr:general substrate transporter [Aureobasidium pullulans EXF-150]KEQ85987.1 general substrate transporter [Aureobasidium pullulans EXF-150]TIA76326.1 general substrate transporter [Aureobasidium pullulans]